MNKKIKFKSYFAIVAAVLLCGCETTENVSTEVAEASGKKDALTLIEGDILRIEFPGAPSLNTEQAIRRDGKLGLALVGEVDASGLTLPKLEEKLLGLYESQLVTKEVTVSLISSDFPVFVNGAVLNPGKIQSDRALTALEAVMEAGGFDLTRAKTSAVVVTRRENGKYVKCTLNLKAILEGKKGEVFYLRPSDIVFVPEKITIF